MMSNFQGWLGETKTAFYMWLFLNAKVYKRVHNLIIPSDKGTSQIDHLVLSEFGIFIVETKNIKGWIFGLPSQGRWTQVIFGKKYSFQNPLRQTFRQKRMLAEYLGLSETFIHTIIYFTGACRFKTSVPKNVINSGLITYIKQHQEPALSPAEIDSLLNKLNAAISDPSLTMKNHVTTLRERYSSSTVCPKCGSPLKERMSTRGPYVGSKFLGCTSYPICKFTKTV